MDSQVCTLVGELQKTHKYGHVCAATLDRVARWALARYPQPKQALKMAKNKLHQIHGAYLDRIDVNMLARKLARPDRECCSEVLMSHASTKERMPFLDDLYIRLFRVTRPPQSVLDLACGLHPFALPWMNLPASTRYVAIDIDERLATLNNTLFCNLGMPALALCRDLLADEPFETVDVAFLLKTLPCLDQQAPAESQRLLARLHATWLIVSFPTKSLCGRRKAMHANYAAQYEPLLEQHGVITAKLELLNEMFYIVRTHSG